jgi:hypothetical protein
VTVRGLDGPGFESVQWQDTSLQNVQTDSGALPPLPQPVKSVSTVWKGGGGFLFTTVGEHVWCWKLPNDFR